MTKSPAVSVLMTAYNVQKYIGLAIESILSQTFSDFEFIILDDASTDRTWQIIQDYSKNDSRITALKNETNLGISASRNRLVSIAKGKYIVWQDADDISLLPRLEKQYQFMEANPQVGICGGWLHFFNQDRNISIRKYRSQDADLRRRIFRYSPVAQPAAIIRKDALEKTGRYDESLAVAEDLDMSFRLGRDCQFANLPEIIVKYREHSGSTTYKKIKELEKNTFKIRRRFLADKHYHFSSIDFFYNLVQFSTMYLLPPRIRVAFFNFIRNVR